MKMKFENWTTKEFNATFDTQLTPVMTFDGAMTHVEIEGINYFYASTMKEDVLEEIKAQEEIAEQLDLCLIHITDLGIYIATHQ